MKRPLRVLLVLLIGATLVWVGAGRVRDTAPLAAPSAPQSGELAELRARIAELEAENAALRRERDEALAARREVKPAVAEPLQPAAAAAAPRPAQKQREPREATAQAWKMAEPWVADALQIQDAAKREAAIESIRAALLSGDPIAAHAALIALPRLHELAFDKASFRPLVLPHIQAESAAARRAALYALYNTAPEPGDIELVLPLASDPAPEMRESMLHVLALFSGGDLQGRVGEAALTLLAERDPGAPGRPIPGLNGISGCKVSPEIDERLVALVRSGDAQVRRDAIHFGLSTLSDKSAAVVDELIAVMSGPDANDAGRAIWGLTHGVQESLQPRVADAFLALLESRPQSRDSQECLDAIRAYGTLDHVAALDRIAENPLAAEGMRTHARQAAEAIRARAGG